MYINVCFVLNAYTLGIYLDYTHTLNYIPFQQYRGVRKILRVPGQLGHLLNWTAFPAHSEDYWESLQDVPFTSITDTVLGVQ